MEYTIKTINELCTKITDGSHFSPEHETDGLYPMYSVKDMEYNNFSNANCKMIGQAMFDKLSKADCRPLKNDILIAKDGSYLKCAFKVNEDLNACILSSIAILRPNLKNIDPDYFVYLMRTKSIKGAMANYVSGSALPRIILSDFKKMKLKMILSLPTQQKIASILSAYDNLIQNYKKQIEALQTTASELYKEWFVRFRFPGWQNAKFENGIPEGWKVERLGKLVEIKSGKRLPQGYDFSDNPTSHPYIRARDIKHGNIDSNDFAYISDEVHKKLKRYIVDENDILLTIVANIGDVGYVNKSLQGFNLTENAVRLTHYSERIEPRYLCYYLSQPATKIYMEGLAVGAAQAKLGIYKIETIKVLLPNINIQKDFSRRIALIHTKIDNLNKQITNLTQQRDLLLPRLMSGKLEVK